MKRVLFVDHVNRILGGGEINLLELLGLVRQRQAWEVACACPARSRLGEAVTRLGVRLFEHGFDTALNEMRVVGRRFSPLAAWRGWNSLRAAGRRLAGTIDAFHPDAVISCTNKDDFCAGAACRGRGVPSIWWVNDLMTADFFPAPTRRAFFWKARRDATRLVAVSEAGRAALLAGGVALERVVVVHNGIPLERYVRGAPGAWRCSVGLPADASLIGLVGRYTPWKGQDFFLRLAAARAAEAPAEHYVLIGQAFNEDQEFEAGLKRFVQEHGLGERVHFVPFQERIAEALGDLDAVVHASTRPEPFGRVIIEAMAVGVPVIAARAGGVPEIITDGVDGLLAPPGDLAGYQNALRRVAGQAGLRATLVAAARRTVEQRFTLEHALSRWDRLLGALG